MFETLHRRALDLMVMVRELSSCIAPQCATWEIETQRILEPQRGRSGNIHGWQGIVCLLAIEHLLAMSCRILATLVKKLEQGAIDQQGR